MLPRTPGLTVMTVSALGCSTHPTGTIMACPPFKFTCRLPGGVNWSSIERPCRDQSTRLLERLGLRHQQ